MFDCSENLNSIHMHFSGVAAEALDANIST